MDASFWIGLIVGLVTSGVAWYVPAKLLVPKLSVGSIRRVDRGDGSVRYAFDVENVGPRDIVDASISCTLYSVGWGDGDAAIWATIEIPTTVAHINVVPGKGYPWSRQSPLREIGARVVTLKHTALSQFQLNKLVSAEQERLARGTMTLSDLFDLGQRSFINVTVYGADAFSGTRSVFTGRIFERGDLPAEEGGVPANASGWLPQGRNGGSETAATDEHEQPVHPDRPFCCVARAAPRARLPLSRRRPPG